MIRTLLILLSIPALLFSTGCAPSPANGSHAPEAQAPTVEVYTVKSEPMPLLRELPGRTAAFNVAEVRPQVNGIILKRKFEEGALVEEGQELYEIDSSVYKANFDKATSNLESMERARQRAEQLRQSKTMSEQEYEDALYAWEIAKADLELARLDLEYCKVNAPLSGKIGRSTITVGALVTNGQPQEMAVIQQLDPIYVDLKPAVPQMLRMRHSPNESEERLPFWQGADVRLTLEDGSEYPHSGKIKFIDNHVQEDTGTVTLRAEIPNPEGALLPGMFVRASVEEGVRRDGKLIPQQGLLRDMKRNAYVWVVREDDTVERRDVQVSRALGNTWLVDSGLAAGERIIVEGVQFVEQNAKVVVRESEIALKTTL